jgi:hypothetical protein
MNLHLRLVFIFFLSYFVPGSLFGAITLQLNQTQVDLSANAGTTRPVTDSNTNLSATGSGSANISISISGNAPWLTARASSGTITAGGPSVTITITANPTGLHANNQNPYKGTVTISAGGSTVTITVNFTVSGIDIAASLRAPFAAVIAGQQSPTNTITLTVANNGNSAVQIAVSTDDGGNWLVVNNNQATAQAPSSIPVLVDATSLMAGVNHSGNITFSCSGGSPCLPITVTVSVSIVGQSITGSPTSLSFSTSSASTLQPQTVSLSSGGTQISFTLSQSQASASWLSFTTSSMTTPATLTVSVSTAMLRQQAIYSGSILITPSNGSAVVNIPVSFDFTPNSSGFSSSGSMGQVASGGFWTTTFTLVNNGTTAAQARINFFDDNGNPLPLPLIFPQTSPTPAAPAATLDRTLNPGAMLIVQTAGLNTQAVQTGWAQLLYNGNVGCYSVFGQTIGGPAQEAVVPLETRTPGLFVIPFDTTGGYATGVALANLTTTGATIPVIIRDDNGNVLQSNTIVLAAMGHTSFDLGSRFPITAQRRGTVQFQTPAGGQITVLGLRFPPGPAFSTIPALDNSGSSSGGSMAQVASAGFWTTTFTLVNNGSTPAQIHMNFFDDNGNPLPLPLIFPQTSPAPAAPATTLDRTLNPGAMLIVQTTGPNAQAVQTGWAQLLSSGNVGAFAVFGQTIGGPAQEAVVPLETRTPGSFVIPFDTTGGYATGVALANGSTTAATIPVIIRDDNGNVLQSTTVGLAAQGHTSFDLGTRFPITAQRRGTLEFQTPAGGQIRVLGLRFPPGPAFSTIPALAK